MSSLRFFSEHEYAVIVLGLLQAEGIELATIRQGIMASVVPDLTPVFEQLCQRCGEVITAVLDLRNDMSAEYDENNGATTFISRKVLMGRQRCFQQIEVTLHFDSQHRLTSKEVVGGQFVEPGNTTQPAKDA